MRPVRFLLRFAALVAVLLTPLSPLAAQRAHVRWYTTKSGKVVAPYTRRVPGTAVHTPRAPHASTRTAAPNATATTPRSGARAPESATKAPADASAQCRDKTYSFSAHRSGTCSHHGGVGAWLNHEAR